MANWDVSAVNVVGAPGAGQVKATDRMLVTRNGRVMEADAPDVEAAGISLLAFNPNAADGVTDASPAIAEALAILQAASATNKTLILPAGTICISRAITATAWSGISIIGQNDGTNGLPATTVKYTGISGGTMLDLSSVSGLTTGFRTQGILWDGNSLAGTGIKVRGLTFSYLQGMIVNATTTALDVDTSTIYEVQGNTFDFYISLIATAAASANGLVVGDGTAIANTNWNDFRLRVVHKNGKGIHLKNADSNKFWTAWCDRLAGGSGLGIDLAGTETSATQNCRSNLFGMVQAQGGITARGGTYPTESNTILCLNTESGTPFPTIESGAQLAIIRDDGLQYQFDVVARTLTYTYGYGAQTDPNLVFDSGFRTVGPSSNLPEAAGTYHLLAQRNTLTGNSICQIAIKTGGQPDNLFVRYYNGSAWSSWARVPVGNLSVRQVGGDADSLVTNGTYSVNNCTHMPTTDYYFLTVQQFDFANGNIAQQAFRADIAPTAFYVRLHTGAGWSAWKSTALS